MAADVSKAKPVVAFKAAGSRQAATVSVSHTGFLGGSHRVVEGAFEQAGVISVDSVDELVAAAKVLAMQPRAKGACVGLISNGAGAFVQAIDLLEAYSLELPPLGEEMVGAPQGRLSALLRRPEPDRRHRIGHERRLREGRRGPNADRSVDIVMPWFVFQNSPLDEGIVEVMNRLNSGGKPIVCAAMGGPYTDTMSAAIEEKGVPVFHAVRDWVAAASALVPRVRLQVVPPGVPR